jgi:hypothetical protein
MPTLSDPRGSRMATLEGMRENYFICIFIYWQTMGLRWGQVSFWSVFRNHFSSFIGLRSQCHSTLAVSQFIGTASKDHHLDDILWMKPDRRETWRKQYFIIFIIDATPSPRSARGAVPGHFQPIYVEDPGKRRAVSLHGSDLQTNRTDMTLLLGETKAAARQPQEICFHFLIR